MLAAALTLCAAAHADEGMWTLYNLPQAVYEQMKSEGFTMPYDELYKSDMALKNAVVNFSGFCTGVVVSPDGLVFTNHHCGFESIRSHSTVEHDYMLNGFYAKSYAEELPNENMFVSFMVDQKDVTPQLERMGFAALSNSRRALVVDSLQRAMTDSVKKIDKTLHVNIDAFYEGNKYYATTYQDFTDLRLVFAVPKSMGKFGGETDNWMWPRQTCDFSVFRIYADPKTGGPATYSKDNVPYHPAKWAQVSLQGYKEGDFAMTMGYPGSTERYLSSFGIKEMRDAQNLPRWQTREVKQEVMLRHMRADEGVRIKYDSKYANSANYWKNAIGMNKCIDSLNIIGLKESHERAIQSYVDSTGYLKDKLDLALLKSLYEKRFNAMRALTLFMETYRADELSVRARKYTSGGVKLEGPKGNPKKQYRIYDDNSDTYDEATDKEMQVVLLKNYAAKADAKYMPGFFNTIKTTYGGDYAKYVDDLWSKSILMKTGTKIYDNKKTNADMGVLYGLDLFDVQKDIVSDYYSDEEAINEQERYLCAAKIRMEQDMPHYSDANFTLRLSYGQVASFNMNGKNSGYYTTPQSLVAKMKQADNNFEYFAEPVMHDIFSVADFGNYTDKTTNTMNLCFLTTNDITGGNSGSPVFDGKNQLIGLAFDGNWDSLSADIYYDKTLARCICVDIRYVLYMMDKWGHADRLLNEIGAK